MSSANKLADILSRSKAVMQKTEQNHGSTSNGATPTTNAIGEKEMPNLTEGFISKHSKGSNRSVAPQGGNYRNLKTSKMPKEVLEAMVNNPIEIPESPNHTFELADVEDLVNESVTPQSNDIEVYSEGQTPNNTKSIRDIVREEIGDVVREVVEEYLDKSLVTEDIKIKIGDTVFGGKLKPLPTKKKKRV